ncbi:unnamed protein product [Rotaria socialis]|uniref:NAD(P)(+)--arginine ADP-ribosyltransferase n=1 Tax=Rotaria socialis TaxID=392032 RepID=A0A818YDN9_9BILA|nr:unnamed protein product [Rotaria socialis]CAF4610141.1 unnamed protein product [Rotaria socialis]
MASYGENDDAEKEYLMEESEANRLLERHSHMDVFKKVQEAQVTFGDKSKKVPQRMYLQPIGRIPDYQNLPNSRQFDSEIVELYIENAKLHKDAVELWEKRHEYAIIEDDFGPTLEKLLNNGVDMSLNNLKNAIAKYDQKPKDVDMHVTKSKETFQYFTQRGVGRDEAQAFALAIAFYTGKYAAPMSMAANIVARQSKHGVLMASKDIAGVDTNAALIMYYLIKGLSHIDYYWGIVHRCIELTEEDLADYKPGEIVTWLQFSSADKREKGSTWFTKRNTIMTIFSLTGRSIRYFSNCDKTEDEVLFLPHSSFLVCHLDFDENLKKNRIFLRQIELGLCKNVVMWVDDNIFNPNWENKEHMEKASTQGTHVNVHFIPKSSTELALAFLRSPFGKRLKLSETFRFVTDMKRTNENESNNAGARFVHEARALGFNQSCLIFTKNEAAAQEKLNKVFARQKQTAIKTGCRNIDLENFVTFK